MHVRLSSVWTIPAERPGNMNKTQKELPEAAAEGRQWKPFGPCSTFRYPNPADCRTLGNHVVVFGVGGKSMHLLEVIKF